MDPGGEEQQRRIQHRFPEPRYDPWLCYLHGRRSHIQTFYSLSEDQWHNRYIPEMRGREVVCSLHGWLVLTHQFDNDDCLLLNPLSMKKIQLPPLPESFSYHLCILTSVPHNPNCTIMFIDREGHLAYCKPSGDDWTIQELTLEYNEDLGCSDYIKTIGLYNGEIYILTDFEKLLRVGFNPCFRAVDLGVESVVPADSGKVRERRWFLVESSGDLFIIERCFLTTDQVAFNIYKVNLEEKKWVIVESVEDRAFFLGSSSNGMAVSCSSADETSNIKGDTIYFTRSNDKDIYEFNLKDKTLVVSPPSPNVILNWISPEWISSTPELK